MWAWHRLACSGSRQTFDRHDVFFPSETLASSVTVDVDLRVAEVARLSTAMTSFQRNSGEFRYGRCGLGVGLRVTEVARLSTAMTSFPQRNSGEFRYGKSEACSTLQCSDQVISHLRETGQRKFADKLASRGNLNLDVQRRQKPLDSI